MLIIGNYDLSGTNKFISHLLRDDEETTYCGLKFSALHGDWQFEENSEFGCLRCRKIYDGEMFYHRGASNNACNRPASAVGTDSESKESAGG